MATRPTSPEPGTTSAPCSVMTLVVAASWNDADAAAASAVVALVAIPIASDEPSVSTRISRSLWRSRPCLVSFDHITPDEMTTRRAERSQRSGSASRARRIGRPKASPTIVIDLTRSRSTVSSKFDGVEVATREGDDRPARRQRRQGVDQAGPVHQRRRRQARRARPVELPGKLVDVGWWRQAAAAQLVEGAEQVVLPPHHPLGHARRAAGVEQQEVIARAAPRRLGATGPRRGHLPRTASPSQGTARSRRRPTATCGSAAGDRGPRRSAR